MKNDKIKDIVNQPQRLQIEQASLVNQLSRATDSLTNVVSDVHTTRVTIPGGTAWRFNIRDRVRVKTPGIL
jgi:hypothetical protein